MKRIKYIIVALSLGLCSCDDYLDITPDGQVKGEELINSKDGLEDALYGAYSQLRSTTLYGQELSFGSLEIMGGYMSCRGNNAAEALIRHDYEYSTNESMFEGIWTEMYKNISNVNNIIGSNLLSNPKEYRQPLGSGLSALQTDASVQNA